MTTPRSADIGSGIDTGRTGEADFSDSAAAALGIETEAAGTPSSPTELAADDAPTPDLKAQIRLRAYELWLAEGRPEGRDRIHWEQAERDIRGAIRGPEAGIASSEIQRNRAEQPAR